MNELLLSAIKNHDWAEIRRVCFSLSEEERESLIRTLQTARWEQLYHNTDKRAPYLEYLDRACFSYIFLCVSHNSEELKKAVKGRYKSDKDIVANFLQSCFAPLLDLLTTKEGKYLSTSLQSLRKNQFLQDTTFQNLWTLYQKGFIALDEDLFIEKIFFWNYGHITDEPFVNFLLANKEIAEKIFAVVPQHITQEVPYPADTWKELYHILQTKGFFTDRSIVSSHIETLLNPYKKNVLDFYCRIVETFDPTTDELLDHQYTLFALLSSDKTSVVNFAVKLIKQIADEKAFDFPAFADAFALCFTMQKIAKSQLIGLSILEKHYKKQAPANIAYREPLAVLFTVPDTKLQEKVAALLTTYFSDESLAEVVAPYQDYLKGKAQTLCQSPKTLTKSEFTDCPLSGGTGGIPPLEVVRDSGVCEKGGGLPLLPLTPPTTWDTLLFLLGDCLREKTPATIDLFFEGLVQLQDQIPADAKKQLAPYLKQMDKHRGGDIASLPILRETLLQCLGEKSPYDKREQELFAATLPYLAHKAKWLLKKIQKGSRLPFLSTPTHAPFYIEAETLVNRLLQYEAQGVQPDLEDLVVACNRLLFKEVSATAQEKVQQLKGAYSQAIQYILGLTNTITPTDELLPLWTQIARIKHPDSVFEVFENTSAKDIPSAVKPFALDFEVKMRKQSTVTFYYLNLADNWNDNFDARKKSQKAPVPYYNAGICDIGWDSDVLYQCSLSPHYAEAQIARFIASYAKGNEVAEIMQMQMPMQVLLDYKLPIYHGGWLYVAVALLFEKRPSRDLANSYIVECLQTGADLSVLASMIAKLLAENFAPINRFVEFLDMPTRDPKIKDFQKNVVQEYLRLTENVAKKPTNHKKMIC